jgi:hypothetical protein
LASKVSNNTILWYDPSPAHLHKLNVAAATTLAPGDLISKESNLATAYSTLEDDATFMGVCLSVSEVDDVTPVTVSSRCVIRTKQASAAASFGKTVLYVSGANGTDYVFIEGTADTVGWMLTDSTAVVTAIDVLVDTLVSAQGAGLSIFQASAN